jgi:hypothetical protein
MDHLHQALAAVSMGSLLVLGACGMAPMAPMAPMPAMAATSTALTARLSGASEVPAVMTDATGKFEASLAAGSNLLTWKITYAGLSGPVTGAHFHGPAMAGQNAAVVVPIGAPLASPITGSATLTPSQAADLSAGKWYVNLHTAANQGGEARGQVSVGR